MTLPRKAYGLIGYPVKHSLSPCMQNAGLRALGLKAKYSLFEVTAQQLPEFFRSIKKNKLCGFNVTIPYKEKALAYLNSISLAASQIGAVNTVVVGAKGLLKGFNTDYQGFMQHLKVLKVKPRKVALIGAGGGAKAVCFALGKLRAEEVCIYDIDKFRALSLVAKFKDVFPECKFSVVLSVEDMDIASKDLLVNASPIGMRKDDPCLLKLSQLHKNLFVYDLVYNPCETKLLNLAKIAQIQYANGLGMLLYQGALSLRHFTNRLPPIEVMQKALEKGARKL
ncbi:MAG: shikimate dehydrogenase [Candidatus Omnitrophica bacterium]|jgi:shikimate dehydrogenase|nr:shikimate dehydrogenase [Candidatus Omnitrophota bacterium]